MSTAAISARTTVHSAAAPDKFNAILSEAVDKFKNDDRVQFWSAEGLREIIGESVLWRAYKEKLTEGMDARAADQVGELFENVRNTLLSESSLSGIQPIASLTMPVIRKAWPRIGIKEGLPTEPAKTPKLAIPFLVPYIKDPATGTKLEIPAAIKAGQVSTSQSKILETTRALPLAASDVMPAGATVAAGYVLDVDFRLIAVDATVKDSGNANSEVVTNQAVIASVGAFDAKTQTLKATITFTHSTGNQTTGVVYGYVDRDAGVVTLASLYGASTATVSQITGVYLRGKIESTNNKKATVVGFDVKLRDIDIGTGEHFEADLPTEWLQDNMALYNIDGQLKVIDLLTEVIAQNTDIQGYQFLQDSYSNMTTLGQTFLRTFDVHPSGQFTGSPTDWLRELRRVIDNLANYMRDYGNFAGGKFVIFAHPTDACLIPGVDWQFGAMGADDDVDGVSNLSYSVGIVANSGNRYRVVASQNVAQGTLWVIFVPGQPDHMTYKYYPYTFNVVQSSAGFASPNSPNVPAVMVSKRHKFYEFLPLIGKVVILNNDGSLPT